MADPLVVATLSLREAARTHKRLQSQHRREAQRLMAAYTELAQECARRGIRLNIESEDGSHG